MDTVVTPFQSRLCNWAVNRRIKLSLISFSMLVAFNLLFLKTRPLDPLAIKNPIVVGGIVSILTGVFLRSWSAGTLHKSQELTTGGPYALVRNPLYLGSFLMMLGFCILMRDWLSLLFVCGPIALLYWLQIKAEERNLSEWFPGKWVRYASKTPRIFPWFGAKQWCAGWSATQWLKNREYNAFAASVLGIVAIWCLATLSPN